MKDWKKTCGAAVLMAFAAAASVSAEQPKAEEYRRIISGGTYCIEWNGKNGGG